MSFDGTGDESDEALLERFAAGDRLAARALTMRHTPRVLALATRMLRDGSEAEDVAQEAMMRLWRIAPDWRAGEAKLSTWLHRIAANLCIDRLRKRRDGGAKPEEAEAQADTSPTAAAMLIAGERGESRQRRDQRLAGASAHRDYASPF